jgi:hypothetical protein
MRVVEIKEIAKKNGIKTGKLKKAELVRAIQEHEGNKPCFQTAVDACDQSVCCWRSDCIID